MRRSIAGTVMVTSNSSVVLHWGGFAVKLTLFSNQVHLVGTAMALLHPCVSENYGIIQGTTTNGKFLLPFRTGAFVAGLPVQPVLLRYPQRKGNPALSWETVRATKHIQLVMSSFLHTAQIFELPMYFPSDDEQNDPRLYADNVRQYMVLLLALPSEFRLP